MQKSSAIAFTDTNSFGLVWPKKMKDKDTLLFNNVISQNTILGKRAWFWHVALNISKFKFPYEV